jgi:outer membrane protein OmpA-like peptidoglycan-associated protein
MTSRYRITTWVAFSDFFVSMAVLAFALYGMQRQRNITITRPDRQLAQSLCDQLKVQGIAVRCDAQKSSLLLPEAMLFRTNSAEVADAAKVAQIAQALRAVQKQWQGRGSFQLIIRGHADERPAGRITNVALSTLRAQSMERRLRDNGIHAPDFYVSAQGVGEFEPEVDNCPQGGNRPRSQWTVCDGREFGASAELQRNRRLELRFGFFSGN